ncbi:MAG TPA: DUF1513 domain-containing protein [Chromatiaceae bacterium]|nr:DUF1513 domain-containing protein [Chromatiaceae bacterium]
MAIERRNFLKGLGALGLSLGGVLAGAMAGAGRQILYSPRADMDDRYYLSAVDSSGGVLFDTPIPTRAHDVVHRPGSGEVVVLARRPGYYLAVIDAGSGKRLRNLSVDPERPLYGHGVFSSDGRYLFTTENDYQNQRGVIGIRDAQDGYRRVGEIESGGIGPHELCLMPDGKTLVIANGGILTHPDAGRSKLNLDTMMPSLAYVETSSGKLVDDFRLEKRLHQLSIRHLDVNADGQVCFAMQFQGPKHQRLPLVGFHRGQASLQLADTPKQVLRQMKNYCGSVCADASGEAFAVSSPRGNLVTFWSAEGGYAGSVALPDGCGLARSNTPGSFFLSSGQGELGRYRMLSGDYQTLTRHPVISGNCWDNHMISADFPSSTNPV